MKKGFANTGLLILTLVVVGVAYLYFSNIQNKPVKETKNDTQLSDANSLQLESIPDTTTITMPATETEVVVVTPSETEIIHGCREITQSGKYQLANDLTPENGACLKVYDVNNVDIDCAGHQVAGKVSNTFSNSQINQDTSAVAFTNVSHFSLTSCTLTTAGSNALSVYKSSFGDIRNNKTVDVSDTVLLIDGHDFRIHGNNFSSSLEQLKIFSSITEDNTFALNLEANPNYVIAANMIVSNGSGNIIRNNRFDGGSDGIFHQPTSENAGADDGIAFNDEIRVTVSGNTFKNFWDCAIEISGLMSDSSITNNKISHAGYCGIGGWYSMSLKNTIIADNTVDDAPYFFMFSRMYGLRLERVDHLLGGTLLADKGIYFEDNTFSRNTFSNPRESLNINGIPTHSLIYMPTNSALIYVPDATMRQPLESELHYDNNRFEQNNFNLDALPPYFSPRSMVVDRGGNTCQTSSDPQALACGH